MSEHFLSARALDEALSHLNPLSQLLLCFPTFSVRTYHLQILLKKCRFGESAFRMSSQVMLNQGLSLYFSGPRFLLTNSGEVGKDTVSRPLPLTL